MSEKQLVFTIVAKFVVGEDGLEGMEVIGEALEKLREQAEATITDVIIVEERKSKVA